MTEEYLYERERDMLDYFRNQMTDPIASDRSTSITETFTATSGQTAFTLKHVLVKNVADTITVAGVTKRKGYDYTVAYGEGKKSTIVTYSTGASTDDAVVIIYSYGSSLIEREFSRTDTKLPRIVMMFLTGSEDFAAIGDAIEGTKGSYFNAAYRFEIRDRYATRARQLVSEAMNVCKKVRHANLFRTNITRAAEAENFDYDIEKEAYVWQFTLEVQWEIMFE